MSSVTNKCKFKILSNRVDLDNFKILLQSNQECKGPETDPCDTPITTIIDKNLKKADEI